MANLPLLVQHTPANYEYIPVLLGKWSRWRLSNGLKHRCTTPEWNQDCDHHWSTEFQLSKIQWFLDGWRWSPYCRNYGLVQGKSVAILLDIDWEGCDARQRRLERWLKVRRVYVQVKVDFQFGNVFSSCPYLFCQCEVRIWVGSGHLGLIPTSTSWSSPYKERTSSILVKLAWIELNLPNRGLNSHMVFSINFDIILKAVSFLGVFVDRQI